MEEDGDISEKNLKIKYKVNHLDSSLVDIIWCGDSKKEEMTIVVLTEKGSVYRTSDKGLSWEKKTEYF